MYRDTLKEADLKKPGTKEQAGRPHHNGRLPFNILVIGPRGSGKSRFAAELGRALGDVKVGETSRFLMAQCAAYEAAATERAYRDVLTWLQGKSPAAIRQLVAFGDTLTALVPEVLIDGASREGSILVGARRMCELDGWMRMGRDGLGLLRGTHAKDILVEIVAPVGVDDNYELAGYVWPGRDRYEVPGPEGMEARARAVADAIRDKYL